MFDRNATALRTELQNLRLVYDGQLHDICGNDVDLCAGGLMRQNSDELAQAVTQIQLARQRAEAIPQRILVEQQRAGQIINLILENGEDIAAWDYFIALNSSYSESESISVSAGMSFGGAGIWNANVCVTQ